MSNLDLRTATQAGVPAITWDRETNRIVEIAPEDIPDLPEDDDTTNAHRPG